MYKIKPVLFKFDSGNKNFIQKKREKIYYLSLIIQSIDNFIALRSYFPRKYISPRQTIVVIEPRFSAFFIGSLNIYKALALLSF